MDQFFTTIISGIFSVCSTIATVYLYKKMDRRNDEDRGLLDLAKVRLNLRPPEKRKNPFSIKEPVFLFFWAVALGFLLRLSNTMIDTGAALSNIAIIGILVLLCITYLIFLYRKAKRRGKYFELTFQLEMVTMWFGYFFGLSIGTGEYDETNVQFAFILYVLCSVFGFIVLRIVRWQTKKQDELAESGMDNEGDELIKELWQLMGEDKIDDVFQKLNAFYDAHKRIKQPGELTLLYAKYSAYKKSVNLGIHSKEQLDLEINRIRHVLLQMISDK